ncbi:lipoate--protein ligase family protein [Sporolactobacillus inulinus]|uniref:Octanoyl-[GcvH]:protein N-octanoyltransferase n=1 Tax=Sporolactobacillus inulinus CASD TaxID=1069536 RepID=A0A0U1QKZ6_9BACL|nr:lipoate--protein ligase family protein [Sporolactobacillus inulinus]KLI01421.1 octanoyltransferase [Sporolactobacillus inulinus CASD]GEB77907.1 octanoyl-[GcvH]:protein N-octanoyltransferase [Sporolactobacillus inulinus]
MSLLHQPVWRVIDQSSLGRGFDGRQSFAMDDAICQSVGSGQSPCTARLWVHHQTVMLGIQDTRLPHLRAGLDVLRAHGFNFIVRNSGGLAVVLDQGVLNLSLIFPEKDGALTIDDGFEAMTAFIKKMLAPLDIAFDCGEIKRSYCPGRYDLSSKGRKFAGISQRRVKQGVAVQIYLCVSGSGSQRAQLIRSFYAQALQGEATRFAYPDIDPKVMASLEEISERPLTVQGLVHACLRSLQSLGMVQSSSSLSPEESLAFGGYYERMIRRNEKAFDSI